MGVFKRAVVGIIRRKTQSMILFFIVFILANILLTTLAVTLSLKEVKTTVLNQLPPVVSVGYNYENLYNEEEVEEISKRLPELNPAMANELYKNTKTIVKSFDYSSYVSLSGLSLTMDVLNGEEDDFNEADNQESKINIQGTQLLDTSLVTFENASFISGKGFSESDVEEGKAKVIVSKQFAEANNLDVGYTIKLKNDIYEPNFEENVSNASQKIIETIEYDVEIIGILEIDSIEEYIRNIDSNINNRNVELTYFEEYMKATTFFAPNKFIENINEYTDSIIIEHLNDDEKEVYMSGTNIVTPSYVLNSIDDLPKFEKEAEKIYKGENYLISSIVDKYEVFAKPLTSMEGLLDLVVMITIVSSIIILGLILCIFVFFRKKEMGIYLALGERRFNIFLQLLLETLMITIIAATFAIITAYFFSNLLASSTIDSLLTMDDEQLVVGGFSNYDSMIGMSPEMISTQYHGGFSILSIIMFYGVIVMTIISSQLITLLYLLHLKPKKILM